MLTCSLYKSRDSQYLLLVGEGKAVKKTVFLFFTRNREDIRARLQIQRLVHHFVVK